ncbi:MAG: hypothetical protein K5770_20360 [Lachnospiraceae bacterium]|nr:hypothetical protein [Lachnospiraceae bacterium]
MKTVLVEKPELDKPLIYTYTVSGEDMERFRRKKQRAKELGINLFVLDEDDIPEELMELEYYIIDNYLDMDLDVPEDIKERYMELKKLLSDN